jgi:hypothetical protein
VKFIIFILALPSILFKQEQIIMYYLNPRLAAEIFDGEYIIANLDTGLYFSVQGLAVSMINFLPFEIKDPVIDLLANTFPENSESIQKELTSILNELIDNEIVLNGDLKTVVESKANTLPTKYIASRFNKYADMQDLLLLDPIHDVDEEGWNVKNE